jgi:hypothetical protein
MLCAARTRVVTPHPLLGMPELSKLQCTGSPPKTTAARVPVFPGRVTSIFLVVSRVAVLKLAPFAVIQLARVEPHAQGCSVLPVTFEWRLPSGAL